jgi:hypothetical protein
MFGIAKGENLRPRNQVLFSARHFAASRQAMAYPFFTIGHSVGKQPRRRVPEGKISKLLIGKTEKEQALRSLGGGLRLGGEETLAPEAA